LQLVNKQVRAFKLEGAARKLEGRGENVRGRL
jgi:hypothetical protein